MPAVGLLLLLLLLLAGCANGCCRPSQASKIRALTTTEAKARQAAAAEALRVEVETTLDLGNNVTMKLTLIPAGRFMMGSPKTEKHRNADEGPQRQVAIRAPFHIGTTEVTVGQWKAVMNTEPWKDQDYAPSRANEAAEYISWYDATEFCQALSKKTGRTVRLPTEAEWEYACRAGTMTAFSFGDDPSRLADYAWYNFEAGWGPVAAKKPNAWGLYDMHGNALEWCRDGLDNIYNPGLRGPILPILRYTRGGTWAHSPDLCRCATRHWWQADHRAGSHGFRVVVEINASQIRNTGTEPILFGTQIAL